MRIIGRVTRSIVPAFVAGVFGGSAAVLSIGCASATSAASAPRAHSSRFDASRIDAASTASVLTAADLARAPEAYTALEAVRQLRPLFLRPRETTGMLRGQSAQIAVYINDLYAGGADVLQTVPTSAIESMRYLQRNEALTFASTLTPGDGFIMITLKDLRRGR
jgi:hypothetical protein